MSKHTKGAFGRHNRLPQGGSNPDDIKRDIATVVRSVGDDRRLRRGHGICVFRTLVGAIVLSKLGIPSSTAFGGFIAQIGPSQDRDLWGCCGERGGGYAGPDGHGSFHTWLAVGDDFVDFSLGDWKSLWQAGSHAATWADDTALGDFLWRDKAGLVPQSPSPKLRQGDIVYIGWDFDCPEPDWNATAEEHMPLLRACAPELMRRIAQLGLPQRLKRMDIPYI